MPILSQKFVNVYRVVFRGFIYQVFFTAIILFVGFISNSFSLVLAGFVALIFLSDLFLLVRISRDLAGVDVDKSFNYIYLIIYVIEFVLTIFFIYLAWINFGKPLSFAVLAFFTPIILLLADWLLLGSVTSDLAQVHKYLGSVFYDIYTIMIVIYSIAIAGVTLSALSIYWFDQGLGILNGLIALFFLIKRIRVTYGAVKINAKDLVSNALTKTFAEVPVIIKTDFFKVAKIYNFFMIDAKTYISPVVEEKEKEILMEYLTSRALELVPNIVLIRFEMVYIAEGEIKVAVAMSDGKISEFEKAKFVRVYRVRIHDLEIVGSEDIELGQISDELDLVKFVRKLVDIGVNSVIVSDIGSMSKNALDGWFVDIVKAKTKDAESEVKNYLKSIKR